MFTETQRQIYTPKNADPATTYDPLKLRRTLLAESKGKLNEWLGDMEDVDQLKSVEAEERVVAVARKVFGLGSDHNSGTTDATALEVLSDFLEYLEKKE